MLTVVNPDSRIRNGLPILDVVADMDYYNIQDPYGKSNAYYTDRFVCLWQVTEPEIVGHWKWSGLVENPDWDHLYLPSRSLPRPQWLQLC